MMVIAVPKCLRRNTSLRTAAITGKANKEKCEKFLRCANFAVSLP